MAGIKTITSAPNVFRFYIALKDVNPGSGDPINNPTKWGSLTYTYNDVVDTLREVTISDSEISILSNADSDLNFRLTTVEDVVVQETWDFGTF